MMAPISLRTRRMLAFLVITALAGVATAQGGGSTDAATTSTNADGGQELREAYQKEYAFLAAQKRDLEKRLAEFEQQAEQKVAQTEQSIDALQNEVLALEQKVSEAQERLSSLKQRREDAQRNSDVLRATFQQAGVSFKEHGRDFMQSDSFNALSDEKRLQRVFGAGLSILREAASVHTTDGAFFTQSGDKVDGRLVHFGDVATYGVSANKAGILVPAGGGEMKLWKQPNPDTARALANGEWPQVLPIFLHGSSDNAVSTTEDGGMLETIQSGGVVAWLIMALALAALTLIIARIAFLKRASTSTTEVREQVGEYVERGEIGQAIEFCRQRRGSTAAVVASALRNLDRERESLDDIINESILHESAHLERFGTMILVIAAVAPLLGLLGTVTGMISTFEVITEHGTGDPRLLSGGISTALVTTELGLIVAVPALLIGNALSGWADRIKDDMQKAALRVINTHEQRQQNRERQAA